MVNNQILILAQNSEMTTT